MFTSEFAIRFMVDIKSAVSAKALLKFWIAVSVSASIVLSSVCRRVSSARKPRAYASVRLFITIGYGFSARYRQATERINVKDCFTDCAVSLIERASQTFGSNSVKARLSVWIAWRVPVTLKGGTRSPPEFVFLIHDQPPLVS